MIDPSYKIQKRLEENYAANLIDKEESFSASARRYHSLKALILAGGSGTRLKEVLGDIPKPMASIAGKPFLEYQIKFLKEQGITNIILAVHHMADKIKSYFGDGRRWNVDITYSEEEVPLGTGGAIKKAEKYIDDTFLVLNGDSYSYIDFRKFLEFHESKRSNFTISLVNMNDVSDYGRIFLDGNKIRSFSEKGESGSGLINSGVYLFEPKIFNYIESDRNVSLEKEIFPRLVKDGSLYGHIYAGYFMDIGKPETYEQFKQDILKTLLLNDKLSIRDAMQSLSKTGINIVLITDEDKKLLGVLNERIIKEYILKGGNVQDEVTRAMIKDPITGKTTDNSEKISELLLLGIHHLPIINEKNIIKDIVFHAEKIKTESFPVVRGRAPLRISFAGGGTDIKHFFEKYGGVVINATINKYCYATLLKRADSKIIIDSDAGEGIMVNSVKELSYDGKFDLIKAIIKIMRPEFGFEIYLHNDVLPGRGLGSSASLAVLMINLISHIQEVQYDDYKIAEIAYKAEREELKIKGGWQDQYAAVTGGFSFMEFNGDKTIIYPLRLKEEIINELNSHMLLCYVGLEHDSGLIHTSQEENLMKNEEEIASRLNDTKKIAIDIKDSLLANNLGEIGRLLHLSWMNKKKLSSMISNTKIDNLYETGLKNGALGGRLLGAGAGGYILFFYSPKKRNQLTKALQKEGGEIMNFHFEFKGAQVWSVRHRV